MAYNQRYKVICGGLCAVIALATIGGDAWARNNVALSPLGPLGISNKEAKKVQRWVRSALGAVPGVRLVGTRKLRRLLRKRAHLDCTSRPTCIAGLAKKVGASSVIVGDVGRVGGAYVVYLRLIGGDGKQVRSESAVLNPKKKLRLTSQALAYRLLVPTKFTGSLRVDVDVKGAWIYVDGRRLARSPAKVIKNIPVGAHALRVTHENYRDFVHFVRVDFQKTSPLAVKLSAYAVHATKMRFDKGGRVLADRELPWYRRYWAVITLGVVVAAATTVGVAMIPKRVSRDADAVVSRP